MPPPPAWGPLETLDVGEGDRASAVRSGGGTKAWKGTGEARRDGRGVAGRAKGVGEPRGDGSGVAGRAKGIGEPRRDGRGVAGRAKGVGEPRGDVSGVAGTNNGAIGASVSTRDMVVNRGEVKSGVTHLAHRAGPREQVPEGSTWFGPNTPTSMDTIT